jgi:hypothetical protein
MVRNGKPEQRINQNQNYDTDEYLETSYATFDSPITNDMTAEIELEMADTIYDMRREFKRANKRLRRYYADKGPKNYKKEKTSRVGHFSKRRALAQ